MWTSLIVMLIAAVQFGQSATGELRVTVRDATGLPVACRVMLASEANDISQPLQTNDDGESVAKRCPSADTASRSISRASIDTTR
jgi:hypothetical protein